MRVFSWWPYLFAQVGGRLRPEPFWTTEGAEGLRLRVLGLRLPFWVCGGGRSAQRRRWARLCPCQTPPRRTRSRLRPEAVWHAPASQPELTVDAHDDGALWVRKAVSLPLESPSSSGADEVSASLTWACRLTGAKPG